MNFYVNWLNSFVVYLAISMILFGTSKTILSIMKYAMSELNFEHLIILLGLFKQKSWYFRHFQFVRFSKLARIGSFQVPIAQKLVKTGMPAF
jgi:hypothetical protein